MSTASDISAFEHTVEPAPAETLFRAAFVNWQEAIIELPVKLQILNGGAGSVTTTGAATYDQLVPKAGSWQFIDSVQVVVDGVTVHTKQIHENVNTQFKAITEWDYNYYLKNATTSLFSLDDYEPLAGNAPQALDNVATTDFITTTNNVGEFGMANTVVNKGARERVTFSALDQQSTKLAYDVMGSSANIQAVSKAQVYVAPAGAVAVGAPFYVAHYLACVKLADICDYFKKCPMQKNTRGFIYINYNSSSTNIVTTSAGGVLTPGKISSISNNINFGNTCPIMWNLNFATGNAVYGASTATGLALPASAVTLTVTKFTVLPNQSFTWTVSNGIANPKKLILQPVISNPNAGGTTADTINPFRSPLTTIPATTSPFASLNNLQVTVVDKLANRWASHKGAFKAWQKSGGKKLMFSIYKHFEKHGIENFSMILVKQYEVVDRTHLNAYEQLWLNKFKKSAVNEQSALCVGGSVKKEKQKKRRKEYCEANKEKISQSMKAYYQKRKDALAEERKKHEVTCDCGLVVKEYNLERHKATKMHHKLKNGGRVAKSTKEYYEINKERLNAKIICDCGGRYSRMSKSTHVKSKKHLKWLNEQLN
ncbi:unnamed protein product [Phytophthora lilii]|uniref:Unnamed protein product n=1 Tax=Phytophthora lilii TaxID=2077276 RepID=A0A9W6WZM1_9STRA|nr:unnamed protein product [Phytophthora lilii]